MKRTLVYCACLAVMAGCVATTKLPSKLTLSDDDLVECEQHECVALSERQLQYMANRIWMDGYKRGKRAEKGSL